MRDARRQADIDPRADEQWEGQSPLERRLNECRRTGLPFRRAELVIRWPRPRAGSHEAQKHYARMQARTARCSRWHC